LLSHTRRSLFLKIPMVSGFGGKKVAIDVMNV